MSVGTNEKSGVAATGAVPNLRATVFNLPNQLTWMRLLLAVVMFALLAWQHYLSSMALFIVAAGTDWLDGYFARKYNLVTTLGRILDPFADKVIVCGTFIFLAAIPGSHVVPWMTVVIVGRELLVTALRSFLEQKGSDFSASLSGKLKMVLQCVAAPTSLFALSYGPKADLPLWLDWLLYGSVWSAIVLTVVSGIGYVRTAIRLLRS